MPFPNKATQFSKNKQPEKNGRKPNILKTYIEKNNLSAEDVKAVYSMALSKSKEELIEIRDKPETPFLLAGFITALIKQVERGDMTGLEKALDRVIGKVADKTELSGGVELKQTRFIVNGKIEHD